MDTSNRRPNQGASGAIGDSSMESGDWRSQLQADSRQRAVTRSSLDSTIEKGNSKGEDRQEKVYQKIKAMKDLYLPDLNDMHQQILAKLQKLDSLPQQPDNRQLEKLKVYKNMLERFMQFLQIPKYDILANHKDKLATFKMHIVDVVNSNRRKPAAQQPQAPPPPHMHSGGSQKQNAPSGPQQINIIQRHCNRISRVGKFSL